MALFAAAKKRVPSLRKLSLGEEGESGGNGVAVPMTPRKWNKAEREKLGELDLGQGLNSLQAEAVLYVRSHCKDELAVQAAFPEVVSDRRILRFLRGHKFDLPLATKMFRDMLIWRRENDIDKIRQEIVSKELEIEDFPHYGRVMRFYPSAMHYGKDKNGHPLHIELVGRIDPKKLMSSFHEDEFLRFHTYCMEYTAVMLDRQSLERQELMRLVLIYDLAGLGSGHLRNSGMDMLRRTLKITQDFYPESMHQCFLINAPKLFSMFWGLLKPMLAERTVNKIKVLGSGFRSSLLEHIAEDQLPRSLGGSRPDAWPLVFENDSHSKLDEEFVALSLSKGVTEVLRFAVKPRSFVVWGFFCESGEVRVHVKVSGSRELQQNTVEEHKEEEDAAGNPDAVHVLEESRKSDCSAGSFQCSSGGGADP